MPRIGVKLRADRVDGFGSKLFRCELVRFGDQILDEGLWLLSGALCK